MSERGDFTPQALLTELLLRAREMRKALVVWTDANGLISVSWSSMTVPEAMGLMEIAKQCAYEDLEERQELRDG